MKKFLVFVGTTAFMLCPNNSYANNIPCTEGCFCVQNGKHDSGISPHCGRSAIPYRPDCSSNQVLYFFYEGAISCQENMYSAVGTTYFVDEFSELYRSERGMYGFINNNLILMPSHPNYGNWSYTNTDGVYPCPSSHPNSDSGAKNIFECYRTTANGQKEYYTHTNTQNNYSGNYDNSNINALIQNLQSALNQANTAAQNLQNALNSSNLANTTQSQTATTLNNTNTITKMTNAQTFVSPTTTSAPTTTTQPQTTQSTTATPTTTAPVTMKLSDVKTDSTTSSPLKKLDFGNLSSIFSADKAAVHNAPTGRAALPTNPPRVSHIKKSSPIRATTNGATSTPPQTNTAPAPTRANTKTKRIASER